MLPETKSRHVLQMCSILNQPVNYLHVVARFKAYSFKSFCLPYVPTHHPNLLLIQNNSSCAMIIDSYS